MQYRILTDGVRYRVQHRKGMLCRWEYVSRTDGAYDCSGSSPINYDSEQAAVDYATKTWGESADRVRVWRVI